MAARGSNPFGELIRSDDYRRKLRRLLRFVGDRTSTPRLVAADEERERQELPRRLVVLAQKLLEALDRRNQKSADEKSEPL
jgi:hypothetical protein